MNLLVLLNWICCYSENAWASVRLLLHTSWKKITHNHHRRNHWICIGVCICGVFLYICLCCKRIFPTGLHILKDDNNVFLNFWILSIVCFYPQIGVDLSSSFPCSFDTTYVTIATRQLTYDGASPGGRFSIDHRPRSWRVCRQFCCSGSFCVLCFFT